MSDMKQGILTINAGSSSIKFALFSLAHPISPEAEVSGQIDGIGTDATKNGRQEQGRRAHCRPDFGRPAGQPRPIV
jgi:acetate kinase